MVGNLEEDERVQTIYIVHGLERYNKQGVTIQNYTEKS